MSFWCRIFGHRWQRIDREVFVAWALRCRRCGAEDVAKPWPPPPPKPEPPRDPFPGEFGDAA